jgi:hypothetical protein
MLTIRAPHGNRTVAALVPCCLLAAWGARAAAEAWRLRARPALATLLLASAAIPSAYDYFVRYPRTPDLGERFATGADAVAKWVRAHPELRGLRVHNEFNASVVRFVSGRDDLVFLRPKEMKAAAAPGLYLAPSPESVGGRHLRVTRIAGAWNQRFTLIEVAAQEAGGGDGTPLRYISGENQNRVTFPSPSIQN